MLGLVTVRVGDMVLMTVPALGAVYLAAAAGRSWAALTRRQRTISIIQIAVLLLMSFAWTAKTIY